MKPRTRNEPRHSGVLWFITIRTRFISRRILRGCISRMMKATVIRKGRKGSGKPVGQVSNLRRVVNPPSRARQIEARGRLTIGRRLPTCPTFRVGALRTFSRDRQGALAFSPRNNGPPYAPHPDCVMVKAWRRAVKSHAGAGWRWRSHFFSPACPWRAE